MSSEGKSTYNIAFVVILILNNAKSRVEQVYKFNFKNRCLYLSVNVHFITNIPYYTRMKTHQIRRSLLLG